MSRLSVSELAVSRGAVQAVRGVSFDVGPGEVVAVLGANGAGKSSLLCGLSGTVPIDSGVIRFGDADLAAMRVERRAATVAHVPEGRRMFAEHTVAENLSLAAFSASKAERRERAGRVYELFPELTSLANTSAGKLSGGQQQMVALGRGVMSGAPVLLIDELSLGLAPLVAQRFVAALQILKEQGLAVVLVEQYVTLAQRLADRIIVLAQGAVKFHGVAAALDADVLRAAYLGDDE
jgi:branched-chain amino acid transport system ATP-binding protein